jgi:3-hydroxyacyl-[acyl-carrier-protein] dehydratase
MKTGAPEILAAIPHRPPFLFIDEVIELEDRRILATKRLDPGLAFFAGHYPGNPIMPGVLICEACFQAGALLVSHRLGGWDESKGAPVLTRITDARFRRIVRPGETLAIEVTLDEELDEAFYCTGRVGVNSEAALRVQFVCMLAKA